MFSNLRKFISWAFLKLAFGVLVAAAGLAIYALWLFEHDDPDFAAVHARLVSGLTEKKSAATAARDVAQKELAGLQQEGVAHETRATKAAAIAEALRSSDSWWEKIFGNREQQQINARRIVDLTAMEKTSRDAAGLLSEKRSQSAKLVEKLNQQLQSIDERLGLVEATDSRMVHYSILAWDAGKWFVIVWLVIYFLGRTVRKLVLFYYFAPRIERRRAVQLARDVEFSPTLGQSRTIVETSLWPGETARIRKRYLLAVDEAVVCKSQWLLSWRFPMMSMLSGFVHDVNLHHARAGREYRLAFAHHKNPENEMAVVHVPENGSLVVRPSFLAGVILPPGKKLEVRLRWQFFRWQSWLSGQLRFLEFKGPCRLVVVGRPGLRAERLVVKEDGVVPACRTNQDWTIGFTPNLEYRLIRTTRFWNYFRWDHRLFDAYFVGVGFVLTQTAVPGRKTAFWSSTRNRARKIIGL